MDQALADHEKTVKRQAAAGVDKPAKVNKLLTFKELVDGLWSGRWEYKYRVDGLGAFRQMLLRCPEGFLSAAGDGIREVDKKRGAKWFVTDE